MEGLRFPFLWQDPSVPVPALILVLLRYDLLLDNAPDNRELFLQIVNFSVLPLVMIPTVDGKHDHLMTPENCLHLENRPLFEFRQSSLFESPFPPASASVHLRRKDSVLGAHKKKLANRYSHLTIRTISPNSPTQDRHCPIFPIWDKQVHPEIRLSVCPAISPGLSPDFLLLAPDPSFLLS